MTARGRRAVTVTIVAALVGAACSSGPARQTELERACQVVPDALVASTLSVAVSPGRAERGDPSSFRGTGCFWNGDDGRSVVVWVDEFDGRRMYRTQGGAIREQPEATAIVEDGIEGVALVRGGNPAVAGAWLLVDRRMYINAAVSDPRTSPASSGDAARLLAVAAARNLQSS